MPLTSPHVPGKPPRNARHGAGRSFDPSTHGPNSPARKKSRSPLASISTVASSSSSIPFFEGSKSPSGLAHITRYDGGSSSPVDQKEFRQSGFSTGSSSSKQLPSKISSSDLLPTHPGFKTSFSDEEDYELFGDFGKGSEPPLDSKSMERPTTSTSISGSASSSNGSEEQVYGDFFGNLGDSRSLHHLSPTQSSSSNYAAGNGVSGDSFNCFGTSTTAPLSPFAFPRDSRKNHSDAANSPTFDSASSSNSSLRHTHLPLPAAPPQSSSLGYFGTPPPIPNSGLQLAYKV